jgi:uncharacterized delta-60 repeat protein
MRKLISFGRSGNGVGSVTGARIFYSILAGLVLLLSGKADAQTDFAGAEILPSTIFGSVTNDNSLSVPDAGVTIAGYAASAPLWYQWTAPQDGDVTLDTFGNVLNNSIFFSGEYLDTVVGVYAGSSLSSLVQISANDDAFPINRSFASGTIGTDAGTLISGSAEIAFAFGYQPGEESAYGYPYPFYGPSELHFTAKMGTTYYFAVDTKGTNRGPVSLNWAYKPSGVFRFATENVDVLSGFPLYEAAQTESVYPDGTSDDQNTVVLTYYTYNAPGVLVTVTRVGGSVGRATVNYTTFDGANLFVDSFYDTPGVAGVDYAPVTNTLVFDDFEMSKTILIPLADTGYGNLGNGNFGNFSSNQTNNTVFGIQLSNPQLDPYEDPSQVAPPRIDPLFSTAVVRILNINADPYGPDMVAVTNGTSTNVTFVVGSPTNGLYNFEKANYRVPADVNGTNSPWATTPVTIYVQRSGTNSAASPTLYYRINNYLDNDDKYATEEMNNRFPLQPASDYATPTPATWSPIRGTNSDFNLTGGTISFGANDFLPKPITFTVTNSALTKFNKDFKIELYDEVTINNQTEPALVGMVAETTVTILFNDQNPPAGSVDELYDADFNRSLALYPELVPDTPDQENDPNPGANGDVYSVASLSNNEMLVGGAFSAYNGVYRDGVVVTRGDGSVDTSFDPGIGVGVEAGNFVDAVAVAPDGRYIVAGSFTSYNGNPENNIVRLNPNGSVDSTFTPNVYGTVLAVAVQSDGGILLGGSFTNIDGIPRNFIARLNVDGSLDSTFDAGKLLSGPVNAVALPGQNIINFNNSALNSTNEVDQAINIGGATSGTITMLMNSIQLTTNDFQVYYGGSGTNGVLIYDSGPVTTSSTMSMPFGPVQGLVTNVITVVANFGGVALPGSWNYNGTITTGSSLGGMFVGGEFTVLNSGVQGIAKLTTTGALDTTFSPISGADNPVLSLCWQPDDKLLVGGSFQHYDGVLANHIVRLNQNGTVDTGFYPGSGADDAVYCIQNAAAFPNINSIYIGGAFSTYNGTRRAGFARLYDDGTLDTTFLDTSYNQFAGLKKIYSYDSPAVYTAGIMSDGGLLIAGQFAQVGGGQANTNVCDTLDIELGYPLSFGDTNLWVEPKVRDGVRNRSNIARLIGGSSAGPGNIGLSGSTYSGNRSQGSMPVGLIRTNGNLGPLSANFAVQPGLAQSGQDYSFDNLPPLYWLCCRYITHPTRELEDGLSGDGGFEQDVYGQFLTLADAQINNLSAVTVTVLKDANVSGNLSAQFQLANPVGSDLFYLGGQPIPVGGALGRSSAAFTLIDDSENLGALGFSQNTYIATNIITTITLVRSNGFYGKVNVSPSTSNGTAIAGTDYKFLAASPVYLNQNATSNTFTVTNINNGIDYTNYNEKYYNLRLTAITPHVAYGISNAIVRLVNPNFQGYLSLSASNYVGTQSSGAITFAVDRISGDLGTLQISYATANQTAVSGIDYIGATNQLLWNSGDASPRYITIPLLNPGLIGTNRQFTVNLSGPILNGVSAPALLGLITNATLTIIDDSSYGTIQLSEPFYNVDENGGYATITATRTGGAAGTVSVNFATANGANTVAGINYVPTNGVLTFAPNQLSASFAVKLIDDGVQDPLPFNFSVGLSSVVNAMMGAQSNALVQIQDAETFTGRLPGLADTTFSAAGVNGDIQGMALQGTNIMVAGSFQYVGATPQNYVARLSGLDGSLDTTFPTGSGGPNAEVLAIVNQTDNRLLIGGSFTAVNTVHDSFLARLMTDESLDSSFGIGYGADNSVSALAETFIAGSREIYVGGAFGTFNNASCSGLVRLNNNGSVDYGFTTGSGFDGTVYAVAVYPTNSIFAGKVLAGGSFLHYQGLIQNHLVRLNQDGSVDQTFNLGVGPNDVVHALAIQLDGRVLVGGNFTNFNGTAINRIARLNADGSLDTNFVADLGTGLNDVVSAIAIQPDNRIIVGGQFTSDNGVSRNSITRLLPSGAVDTTINFGTGADGAVDAILIQPADGMIILGGAFTHYDNQPYDHIVRIYGGSMAGSGSFQFSSAEYYVNENGYYAGITILREGGTSGANADGSGDMYVQFSTSNGQNVANGVNYQGVTTNVDFPAGEVAREIFVPIINDGVVQTNPMTVNLTLSNPTPPAGLGSQSTATLNISNVDTAVSFQQSVFSAHKSDGFANIDVSRIGGNSGTCTVEFFTITNGTALLGTDYLATNATLTFVPGQSDVIIQVPIINNKILEGNTTVEMCLTNASDTLLYAPSNATLVIQDTVSTPGDIKFLTNNYYVTKTDGTASLSVIRTNGNGSFGGVSVDYYTVPGTALVNANYIPQSGTLTFNPADTVKTINIRLIANNLVQGTVNFSVVLTNAQGGASLVAPSIAVVNIFDSNVGFSFVTATNYVSETNAYGAIYVQRIGAVNGVYQVNYATTNNGNAIPGVNYTPVSGAFTFQSGETLKSILVPLIDDHQVTGNLTFGVNLYPTNGSQVVGITNTVVVEQDGDAGFSFTNANMSVLKKSGQAVVTVICSNPAIEPVLINTNIVPLSVKYATADGTAVAGEDYTKVSGTMVFTNGIGTNTFVVPIINNQLVEGDRSFTVTLSNPTAPGQLVAPYVQTIKIIDSNSGLKFSSPFYTAIRTNVSATITILRTDNTNVTSEVNFSTADGTGVAGVDYVPTNGVAVFTNGVTSQSFVVSVIANNTVEPDKTVLLELSAPNNGVLVSPYSAILTIHDTSGSFVEPAGSVLTSESFTPANGIIDPNETVTLLFGFRAAGGNNIGNLQATLLATNGISNPSGSQYYGPLLVGGPAVSRPFSFTALGTNSQTITATFNLADGTNNLGIGLFSYTLGTWTMMFSNTAPIIIYDLGIAGPYPSSIVLSNLNGLVYNTTVTLTNLSHGSISDVNVLLVAPNQKDTLLMSHVGGPESVANITLTFDDAATNSLPQFGLITTGTNKPSAYYSPGSIIFP